MRSGVIPPRLLEHPEFRYVVITGKRGEPYDGKSVEMRGWSSSLALNADHPLLAFYIRNGRNIGVQGGFGNLLIIDIDDADAAPSLIDALPLTYMHKSAGRGLPHLFYIVDAAMPIRIVHPETGEKMADVRWRGGQVVIPPSKNVKTGKPYEIVNDLPITVTTLETLREAIRKAGYSEETLLRKVRKDNVRGEYALLFGNVGNAKKAGGSEYLGSHPVHGSTTGHNFAFDTSTGLWFCFRCNCGGGYFAYRLMIDNQLTCRDAIEEAQKTWRNK